MREVVPTLLANVSVRKFHSGRFLLVNVGIEQVGVLTNVGVKKFGPLDNC